MNKYFRKSFIIRDMFFYNTILVGNRRTFLIPFDLLNFRLMLGNESVMYRTNGPEMSGDNHIGYLQLN